MLSVAEYFAYWAPLQGRLGKASKVLCNNLTQNGGRWVKKVPLIWTLKQRYLPVASCSFG
jgi:hypothetical protein